MRTVAVIPARMNSSRLPGKVMIPVMGKPLLGHLIDRLQLCNGLDEILVATTIGGGNDAIRAYCEGRNVPVFRGSELDVLERLVQALEWREAETGVLVFGDCPLIDPAIVTRAVNFFGSLGQYDFVGNDLSTTWPPGMETEVFKVNALADSAQRCTDTNIREHATLYLRQHPDLYRLHNLDAPPHLHRPELSLEVDVSEDLMVIEAIMTEFNGRADITLKEIISYMDENPALAACNRDIPRVWRQYRHD
jgi:spore coat polysaccharide biosynthesis protein SpsF (cytidylyltransferase family)